MTGSITVHASGRDRDGRARPSGEAQRADARRCGRRSGDAVARSSADDRCAASSCAAPARSAFSPGNDIAEFATRARRTRRRPTRTATSCTRTARALARLPPSRSSRRSTASASAAASRSRRCATCGSAATSSRFGAPIKNLGPRDGLRRDGAARARSSGAAVALEILLEGRIFDARGGAARRGSSRASSPTTQVASRGARDGAAHRRRRAARRALAQEVRAPAARIRGRSRRPKRDEGFACFDTRGLPRGLRGVPREAQAAIQGR